MHWDFVISCFEPVGAVTGGIGTYTRLLLRELGDARDETRPRSILFLTSERHRDQPLDFLGKNTRVEYLPSEASIDGVRFTNLLDAYRHFGWNLMQRLRALQSQGHTFGLLEVPDFSAEGAFTLRARTYGLLDIERVAVRLHSPLMMLHRDNDTLAPEPSRLRSWTEETQVYRDADHVLFGGDAMLERVASLLPNELAESVRKKAIKVPHPWPEPSRRTERRESGRTIELGYLGRLEWRKGVDLLVRAAVEALNAGSAPFRVHFFGKDTQTYGNQSVRKHLDTLIPRERSDAFVFHDYVPQAELWANHLPKMDGFVFPSRFENYPNVLLEVLERGVPILVSKHGCMPEMGEGFPTVTAFDPLEIPAFAELLRRTVEGRQATAANAEERYLSRQRAISRTLRAQYASLLSQRAPPTALPRQDEQPVSIIVPHFNQANDLGAMLASAQGQLKAGDELIVVDDGSTPDQRDAARRATEAAGFRFVLAPVNAGPAAARNLGVKTSHNPLLHFVDADDEIAPGGLDVLRRAFAVNPALDVATGGMHVLRDENYLWAAYDPTPASVLLENCSHCGIMIRREVFDAVGGYWVGQRHHIEDWELHMRLVLEGYRFEALPEITYRYRVNKQAGRNSQQPERIARSYHEALSHALASVSPERVAAVWPFAAPLLAYALSHSRGHADTENPLRYELVDSLNAFIKRTPLHRHLKRAIQGVRGADAN